MIREIDWDRAIKAAEEIERAGDERRRREEQLQGAREFINTLSVEQMKMLIRLLQEDDAAKTIRTAYREFWSV